MPKYDKATIAAIQRLLQAVVEGRWLGRLGVTELKAWLVLLNHVEDPEGTVHVAISEVARLVCISERNAKLAIASLNKIGFLVTLEKGGGRSIACRRVQVPPLPFEISAEDAALPQLQA